MTVAEIDARIVVLQTKIANLDDTIDFMEDGTQVLASQMKLAHLKELDLLMKQRETAVAGSVVMSVTWLGKKYPNQPEVSDYTTDD